MTSGNQRPPTVNDVSFGSIGRFCATPASQLWAPRLLELRALRLGSDEDGDVWVGVLPQREALPLTGRMSVGGSPKFIRLLGPKNRRLNRRNGSVRFEMEL
jgi:hypothetical protein